MNMNILTETKYLNSDVLEKKLFTNYQDNSKWKESCMWQYFKKVFLIKCDWWAN